MNSNNENVKKFVTAEILQNFKFRAVDLNKCVLYLILM